MALTVRPPVWPPAPADIRPGRNDARLAAQKAFFEAAMAGRPATASPAPSASPRATPADGARAAAKTAASAEAAKLPPPGSHLDIWV